MYVCVYEQWKHQREYFLIILGNNIFGTKVSLSSDLLSQEDKSTVISLGEFFLNSSPYIFNGFIIF